MIFLSFLFLLGSAHAADWTISKAQFVEGIKAGLTEELCLDKSYFRKCFTLTKEDCLKEAKGDVDSCVSATESTMPAQFKQPADGQTWGEKIGKCAGAKFEINWTKKKASTPECSKEWKEK